MPPLPLDERIVVLQHSKGSPLHVSPPQTTSQQSHSASIRNNTLPFKPQLHQTRPHLSSSSSSSSSSSEHRRRSSCPQKPKGGWAKGHCSELRAPRSNGAVVPEIRQRKHTHTIDIKLSLAAGAGEGSPLSRKEQGGNVRHSGSLKGNREKKVSLHVDLGHSERKGRTLGRTGRTEHQLQNYPQNKKKSYHSGHQDRPSPTERNRPLSQFGEDRHQDLAPQTYSETACAGNKENSKLVQVHKPSHSCCQPHQNSSIPVPHASVLNTCYSGQANLSSQSTVPLQQQVSPPHVSRIRERPLLHLHAVSKSCSSSRGDAFASPAHTCALDHSRPICSACCRLVHSGPGGGCSTGCQGGDGLVVGCRDTRIMGLRTLGGCLSTSSTTNTSLSNSTVSDCHAGLLTPLGCVPCSGGRASYQTPAAFRKKLVGGCLPCAPLSSSAPLRVLQNCVGGCNPKNSQASSSSCSCCSSDPIVVSYNPRRGKLGRLNWGGGLLPAGREFSADDDDYSVRTIWPEELAKKMARSKDQPDHRTVGMGQEPTNLGNPRKQNGSNGGSSVLLDCRNLLEFTRSQLTDSAGRRCLLQGKRAVLDFIASGSGRDVGQDSLKRLWTKGGEAGCGFIPENQLPHPPSPSPPPSTLSTLTKPRSREGVGAHPPPSHTLPKAQNHQPLNRVKDEDNKTGHESNLPLSLPLASLPPASLSAEESEMTPDVENAPLSPILPFLFLGNERDAKDLKLLLRLSIGFVVNVTTHLPLYHQDSGLIRYKRLPATDSSKQNLRQYFEEVFEFIEEAHQSGRGVLVHCQAGVSRSATVVIAYMMKHTLMTMMDAYKYVRSRRPVVSPNLNFMGQLLEFEQDLNSGITPRILTPKLNGLETQV